TSQHGGAHTMYELRGNKNPVNGSWFALVVLSFHSKSARQKLVTERQHGGDGSVFDAGNRVQAAHPLTNERRTLNGGCIHISFGIVGHRQPHGGGQYIFGGKSRMHMQQLPEGAEQQPCANDESQ